jgi:hypothetical protein
MQFRLQQIWLDTRFIDSCDRRAFAFRDSYGFGFCKTSLDALFVVPSLQKVVPLVNVKLVSPLMIE